MQLVIDIGNSKTKVGYFEGTNFLKKEEIDSLASFQKIFGKTPPKHIVIGKVGVDRAAVISWLQQKNVSFFWVDSMTRTPLKILYKSPHTLGVDRIAAAVGAWVTFLHKAVLVIDLGSCITYDLVTANGEYLGGAISPGIYLRYKAMSTFTANLPALKFDGFPPLIGRSTEECMQSGVVNGVLFEIEKMIEAYRKEIGDFEVILTGGDSNFFESKIKANIFVNQNLILEGLNTILLSNVSEI